MRKRKARIFSLFILTLVATLSFASCSILKELINGKSVDITGNTDKLNSDNTVEESGVGRALTTQGGSTLPSLGSPNLLVVPVQFKGSTAFTNSDLSDIYQTFFGDSSDLVWESVSSFYKKSSYGKLNIGGMVADTVPTTYSLSYYENMATTNSGLSEAMSEIIKTVYTSLKSQFGNQLMTNFDSNDDGIIDGLWMVYNVDEDSTGSSDLRWAYTSWNATDTSTPVNVYCWASKNFMDKDSRLGGTDSHTYVHETGHMMGLEDYYDTSGNSQTLSPFGGIGMMDYNIQDLDAYSKWSCGWVDPKNIVTVNNVGDGLTIDMEPFESSGDAVVLALADNNGWFGEEYVILEYYTPTGLNERDAKYQYCNTGLFTSSGYPYGYKTSGILAYHVDSRYALYNYSTRTGNESFVRYITSLSDLKTTKMTNTMNSSQFIALLNDNASYSSSSTKNMNFLISIYDASGKYGTLSKTSYSSASNADDSYIYTKGKTLNPDNISKQSIHGDSTFGISMKVDSITSSKTTITISKN